jgi:hypothetical protein
MSSLERRDHGRGHSYRLDGRHAPGVTTALNAGYPKPAIASWAARTAAQEVLDFWEELGALPPSDRFEQVRTAPDRDRDAAARRGTEVHTYAKRLAAGEDVHPPDELVGHVDAYLRFADEWDPRELLVEAVIARRKPRYCGTLDLIADLADGKRWLLDLKTTRSGVFSENALQLAAYRYADFYVDGDGLEQPVPKVDRCGVVWLRGDRTYELVPVEAGEREFVLFRMVLEVARFADPRFARDDYVDVVGAPLLPPEKEVAA